MKRLNLKKRAMTHLMLGCLVVGALLSGGCVTQKIDLRNITQGTQIQPGVRHFEQSSYSIYLLFDLIPVKRADVTAIMRVANPQNKPVVNLSVTSQANVLATIVNILNGGIIDRGVIISLNKVTVEGDLID
jgi:hypothetical protein